MTPADKDALILALLARLDELTAKFAEQSAEMVAVKAENARLRAKLDLPPKTPDNSSTPPSKGQKASEPEIKKPKRKAHAGAHRPLHPNPTRRLDVMAKHCPHCRADVACVPQEPLQAYDRIEIPEIKPDVTRVTLHGGTCPCCRKGFKAEPPEGLEPGSPFGDNLRALVIYLRFTQAIALERLARLFSDLLGLPISEGALVNILAASRPAFAKASATIRQRLLAGLALQSDETSARVGKANWWLWVFHHGKEACFRLRPSRAKAVVEDFLGDVRPDFWVSDRYAGQIGFAKTDHQFCLAHLLRDARYAIEAGDTAFAPGFEALLKRACGIGQRRHQLAPSTLKAYRADLDRRLDTLLNIAPTHAKGNTLQQAIKGARNSLFVFVTNLELPATNNGSEQSLRPCVIFRKVTNCFRSVWAAELYADIRSVIETARRHAVSPLNAIRLTLSGADFRKTA